jgi:two-component system, OmpR family, phosphate regulon response regulator PhoB
MEGAAINNNLSDVLPMEAVAAPAERRVLIIENETDSHPELRFALARAGFKVDTLSHKQALGVTNGEYPHLVMLDWDLPGTLAMDLLRHIRARYSSHGVCLIALSSFAGEQQIVSGFELGLDDYIIKPFSMSEVVARVRAMLRTTLRRQGDTNYLAFHQLQIDSSQGRVTIMDKTVALRRMEFLLLEFLTRRPERAYSRETLLSLIWGNDCRAGLRTVDVTVQRVRRALAPHGCGDYLQTIRGVGYRLSAGNDAQTR